MKKRYIFLIVICLLILVGLILSRSTADPNRQITWGITFEETFAKKLGLDWQAAYLAMLDDLGVKKIRLVAHYIKNSSNIFRRRRRRKQTPQNLSGFAAFFNNLVFLWKQI